MSSKPAVLNLWIATQNWVTKYFFGLRRAVNKIYLFSLSLKIDFNLFNTIKSENIKNTCFFIKFPCDRKVPTFGYINC